MALDVRVSPPNTISLSNLQPDREQAAAPFDVGRKGYLTFPELMAWFQSENNNRLPALQDLGAFLGIPQHKLEAEHLDGWEVLQSQWIAHTWKGDFSINDYPNARDGYRPAGNVRTGREVGARYGMDPVDQTVVFVDLNYMDKRDFDGLRGATLVVGPAGFPRENGSSYSEKVEIPLTLRSEDGYSYQPSDRFGGHVGGRIDVPDKKMLAAHLDTSDLRKLAGGAQHIEFYIRLDTEAGPRFINRDGIPGQNFHISEKEMRPQGNA